MGAICALVVRGAQESARKNVASIYQYHCDNNDQRRKRVRMICDSVEKLFS